MRINVNNGTVNEGESSLCRTCRHAMIVQGSRSSDDTIFCSAVHYKWSPPTFVSRCSEYEDKRLASKWDMEKIAWTVTLDETRKVVGFMSPAERRKRGMDE